MQATGRAGLLGAGDDFEDVLARQRQELLFDVTGYDRVDRPTGEGDFTGGVNDSAIGPNAFSADGRYALVYSDADLLLPAAIDDAAGGVYVRDDATGALTLASRADGPDGAAIAGVRDAAISGDGRHVVFAAEGPGGPGDVNGRSDVFVRDLDTNRTTLVTRAADGSAPGMPEDLDDPVGLSLSHDGTLVTFDTAASLVAGDAGEVRRAPARPCDRHAAADRRCARGRAHRIRLRLRRRLDARVRDRRRARPGQAARTAR